MNESKTRLSLIDPALRAAGWEIVEGSNIETEYPIDKGRLIGNNKRASSYKADYVLQYKKRNLAVIEAKKNIKYYTDGVGQAKLYAEKLKTKFAYSTNGIEIWQIDINGTEGKVERFPTPDELWAMCQAKEEVINQNTENWKDRFYNIPYETKGGNWLPRYYQHIAISKVLDAIANNKNRILLTLATGTGKTDIAFQIAWKLYQTKWTIKKDQARLPRILFLADRNILANQAFNKFSPFEPRALVRISPGEIKKEGKVPTSGSIFFTIFQTFMSGPNNTPYFGDYPDDFFDFIIIDECHRGGANDESTWRAIMAYFKSAVQLGLTATPKRKINADTYNYFREPVYTYSLKEGIEDGFLTPFKLRQFESNIDEYQYEPDDIVEEGEIDTTKTYKENDFNISIEIIERERVRVKAFMEEINQNEKTLVFCATQKHALIIRDLINQKRNDSLKKGETSNTNYCHRVTADDGERGEQHLRDFQNYDKTIPTILTTSYKLSTGVDALEVRNIVLLRPIKSIIEFKQIVGRGTRLFHGKDFFTIYDFVDAYKNFNDPEWDGPPEEPTPPTGGPKPEPPTGGPEPEPVCELYGYYPCRCEDKPSKIVRVKLADGKEKLLNYSARTLYLNLNGKPVSADEYLQSLFKTLPELFKNEDELRGIWSRPDTRKKLLEELSERGFAKSQLEELQRVLSAENSDLYDVLAYIAFHADIIERSFRAEKAKVHLKDYDPKQQEFLNFVLSQYVKQGTDELDDTKIGDLLILKYNAIADAKRELGDVATIRKNFIGFQTFLYEDKIAI